MRNNQDIIDLIEQVRIEKNISISELSRRVGMAKSGVSRYFNKTRNFPLDRVEQFANALEISSEYLLGLSTEQPSKIIDLSNLRNEVVMFDGKPLSDADLQKIAQIIELSLGVDGNEKSQ